MDVCDGRGGISPSTSFSTAEVEASSAVALLGAGLADEGTKREGTGMGATNGVSDPRTTLAQLVRSLGVSGRFGAGTGAVGENANRGHGRCAALNLLDHNWLPSKRQNPV